MNPHFNKCFNVTLDNYFTSLLLTESILSKNSKIVDNERKDRCEITNSDAELKKEYYIHVKYIQMNLDAA